MPAEHMTAFGQPQWSDERRVAFPGVRGIIIATVIAFVLQSLADFRSGGVISEWLALSWTGVLAQGRVWQLVTYMFLHDKHNFLHILFNMVVLFSFGRELEA